jgi:hypothetical protein
MFTVYKDSESTTETESSPQKIVSSFKELQNPIQKSIELM